KTFLDVLEKAGFCKNVCDYEERGEKILLHPVIYQNVAIYGYPGKKSGLEINDLRKLILNDSPGMFKIFMLHTTIDKAKGNLPIDAIECDCLPKADYYALGHIHIDFQYENFVYPGPVFPNNFQELQDLNYGSFYIVDTNKENYLEKVPLKIKDIEYIEFETNDAISATEKIISEIEKRDVYNKILLLRIKGKLENSSSSDIKYSKIEDFAKNKGAYFVLRNTHDLKAKETELELEVENKEDIEEEAIKAYSEQNPSDFKKLLPQLMETLSIEKQEGETTESFNSRLIEESKKILEF
ncbi:MAG: metallophosphoesterase family protein, partial [Minisyncoccales bacterium]